MSKYEVSAIKYRPQNFDDVVGQKALTSTMISAIKSGRIAHSYLFCGPRGVGKTTCARIFAKTINCENRSDSGEACNECDSCMAFNEGRSLNIIETDAASNNSVDNIRDIIDQVKIPPQMGKYKVFIIDEVHMLSTSAFNAFLKTLEEPPAYAVFILATTEKQKILPTIISRCQIYDFKRIETDDIVYQLRKIASRENINAEDEALRVIAEKADGGMRDALSLFDQQTIFTEGNITYDQVIKNLNILDYSAYFRIFDDLTEGNIPQTLVDFGDIVARGFDGRDFIDGMARHARGLLMASDPRTEKLLQVSRTTMERFRKQAEKCKQKALYKVIRLCSDCSLNYRNSRNKQLLVEITLIESAQAMSEEADDHHAASPDRSKVLRPIFSGTAKALTSPPSTGMPVSRSQAVLPEKNTSGHTAVQSEIHASTVTTPTPATGTKAKALAASDEKTVTASSGNHAPAAKAAPVIHVTSMADMLHQANQINDAGEGSASGNTPQSASHAAASGDEKKEADFTDGQLLAAWTAFAESLPIEQSDMKGRLLAMKPNRNDTVIEAECINDYVLGRANEMTHAIEKYLRSALKNSRITVKFNIPQGNEGSGPILSDSEEFKKYASTDKLLSEMNDVLKFHLQ